MNRLQTAYKRMKKRKGIPAIVRYLFFLAIASCTLQSHGPAVDELVPVDKPLIYWTHYDHESGLCAHTPTGSSKSLTFLMDSAKEFTPIPLEDGVECEEIKVKEDAGSCTVWAATLDPVVYSRDSEDLWHIVFPEGIANFNGFRSAEEIRIDGQGRVWMCNFCSIIRTTDDGNTWEMAFRCTDDVLPGGSLVSMEVQGDEVWAASLREGTLIKIDADSLSSTLFKVTNEQLGAVLPASDGKIYIATNSGLYVSSDGAGTFDSFYPTTVWEPDHVFLLEVGGKIWARINDEILELSPDGSLMWRSSDYSVPYIRRMIERKGIIWTLSFETGQYELISIDTTNGNQVTRKMPGFRGIGDIDVLENDDIYLTIPGNLALSTDGGDTWVYKPFNFSSVSRIRGMEGNIWAGLWGGGVARCKAGSELWESLDRWERIDAMFVRSVDNVLFGTPLRVLYTLDGGETMDTYDFNLDNGGVSSFCEDPNGVLYLAMLSEIWTGDYADNNKILVYRSTNGGQTWFGEELVYQGGFPRSPDIVFDTSRSIFRVTSEQGLFRRELNGTDWSADYIRDRCYDAFVDALGNVYVLTARPQGGLWEYFIYVNRAGEAGWDYCHAPDAHQDSELFVDQDGVFWLTTFAGLKYSPNGGDGWATYTTQDGLVSDYITTVYVEGSAEEKTIWVGTLFGASKGIF